MNYPVGHQLNIATHVVFGSLALLLGLGALGTSKGSFLHRRFGRAFLYAMSVVLATAVIGLLVFNFRAFLAVVTLLGFYDAFSGMRALRLRGGRPQRLDLVVSFLAFVSPLVFIILMRKLHLPWAPVLTYSILGGLVATSLYDLSRNLLPLSWLKRVWMQEHLAKMIGAYIAISSAAAGTILPAYLPWSAVVPSAAGVALVCVFLLRGPRDWNNSPGEGSREVREAL